jgi:hypothetical protein
MGVGAGANFAWTGVFFLYLTTFATFVVSADIHCIFCQLSQARKELGGHHACGQLAKPEMRPHPRKAVTSFAYPLFSF